MRKIAAPWAALLAAMMCWGLAGNAVASDLPHIWISPHPGSPGDTVKIYGRDFGPKETIDIYLDKIDLIQVVTWKDGGFGKVPLTVPAGALMGKHHIIAVGRTSGDTAKKQLIVQAAWLQHGFTAEVTRYNPYENTINTGNVSTLRPLWTAQTAASIDSSPAVAYGMVYVGSEDGTLHAFDAMTGATKWMATASSIYGSGLASSPAVDSGVVYIGSGDGKLYAFDAITGAAKWTASTAYSVDTSTAVAIGEVFVAAGPNLDAFDAATGATLWTATSDDEIGTSPAITSGRVWAGWTVTNPPVTIFDLYSHYAVGGVASGGLNCGDRAVSKSSPATSGDWVYFGSQEGAFCGVDPITFASWKVTVGSGIYANNSPAVANGVVYVVSQISPAGETLSAVDATTGAILWTAQTGGNNFTSPAVANGVVYVGSSGGNLYAFDAANGTPLWTGSTGSIISDSPSVANGVVYVGSNDGKLHAFALNGGSAPVHHRDTPMPSFTTLLANRKATPKPH
jgi:outer membrane protein assembly factor BamB